MMRILVVCFESVPQDIVGASSNLGTGAPSIAGSVPPYGATRIGGRFHLYLYQQHGGIPSHFYHRPATIRTIPNITRFFITKRFICKR